LAISLHNVPMMTVNGLEKQTEKSKPIMVNNLDKTNWVKV
jgi:hypothetical protein